MEQKFEQGAFVPPPPKYEDDASGSAKPLTVHLPQTALLVTSAASRNDATLVAKQLLSGFSCNAPMPEDPHHLTPLHWAVAFLSYPMAKSLSFALDIQFTLQNSEGRTALAEAAKKALDAEMEARKKTKEIAKHLTTAQDAWKIVAVICSSPYFRRAISDASSQSEPQDPFQSNFALYCAVKSRNLSIAKALLIARASTAFIEAETKNSLLQVAVIEGFGPMISLLLAYNCGCTADGNVESEYRNAAGQNVVQMALGNPEKEQSLGSLGRDYQPWIIDKEDEFLSGFFNGPVWNAFISKVKLRTAQSYVIMIGEVIYNYLTEPARLSERTVETKTKQLRYNNIFDHNTIQDVPVRVQESVYDLAIKPRAKECVRDFIKTLPNKKAIAQNVVAGHLANDWATPHTLRGFFVSSPNTFFTWEPTTDHTKKGSILKEMYDMAEFKPK